jgi:hypothetical protein
MRNTIPDSPITLEPDPRGWSDVPELPEHVRDAFGRRATIVVHRGRWRALVPHEGGYRFAWLDGRAARLTPVTTQLAFSQTLESDGQHRALVLGATGDRLYAVAPTGAATCLGFPLEGTISHACWLADDTGVALVIAGDLCLYTGTPLAPLVRFPIDRDVLAIRSLPHIWDHLHAIAVLTDTRILIYAVTAAGAIHQLAAFENIELPDVRLYLDDQGSVRVLAEGQRLAHADGLLVVENLDDTLSALDPYPPVALAPEPAPELVRGDDLAALPDADALVEPTRIPPPDAAVPPALDALPPLTRALIAMLRSRPARPEPVAMTLALIQFDTPLDLRAYLHAWAVHAINSASVSELWLKAPRPSTWGARSGLTGGELELGSLASGEPILADARWITMVDDEGIPRRYAGLEDLLAQLRERADDGFELDAWMQA